MKYSQYKKSRPIDDYKLETIEPGIVLIYPINHKLYPNYRKKCYQTKDVEYFIGAGVESVLIFSNRDYSRRLFPGLVELGFKYSFGSLKAPFRRYSFYTKGELV